MCIKRSSLHLLNSPNSLNSPNLPFANVSSPGKMVGKCRANVSSPGKLVGECRANVSSPGKVGWPMSANVSSPTYFPKWPFWRVLEFAKTGEFLASTRI